MTDPNTDEFRTLQRELSKLAAPPIAVPAELDRQILAVAKKSYLLRRRWQRWIGRISAGLAAAAVIVVAVRLFVPFGHTGAPVASERPQLAQAADVNRDGKVDILDAYIVARHLARHEPLDRAWDINGDGMVDQKDVDLIAHLAVQTSGGKQ